MKTLEEIWNYSSTEPLAYWPKIWPIPGGISNNQVVERAREEYGVELVNGRMCLPLPMLSSTLETGNFHWPEDKSKRVSSALCLYIFSKTTQGISFYHELPVIFLSQIVFSKFIWRSKFAITCILCNNQRCFVSRHVKTVLTVIIYNDTLAARVLGSSPHPSTLNVSHCFEGWLIFNVELVTFAFFLFLESLLSGGKLGQRSFPRVSDVMW